MWSEVFLTQAKSDWQVFEHLEDTDFPKCHALHYLQMATEKLAKAYLLIGQTDIDVVRSSHQALTRYLQALSRNKRLSTALGMTTKQLRTHVKRLLPLAFEIEKLAPALAKDGSNPEYPWEAPKGMFHVPAAHQFPVSKVLLEPRGHHLIRVIRTALEKFQILHH
jgi:HEPN domain-containing protein